MTRLLIISQVFHPSHDAVSQLLEDLAVGLAETGIRVDLLTPAVHYMTGEALPRHAVHRGIRIWRVPAVRQRKDDLLGRSLSYGAFLALSGPALALIPRPDVIFYLSTPPFVAWSAGLARRFAGARTVFIAQDVYPEILERSGHARSRWLMRALSLADRAALAGIDRVVVLGEAMREAMAAKGVAPDRIAVIENWAVAPGIGSARRQGNPLLARLGIERKFVVQYSGNMGIVHDLEPMLEAAAILRDDDSTFFLFIGDGSRRAEVERRKAAERLSNVVLLPFQPIEDLPVSLAASDASLLSLRPEMEGLVFPSKLYGILAAGRPVLHVGQGGGELARIIGEAGCGITVQTGADLAGAIERLKSDPAGRESMGARARRLFETRYGRERSIAKYRRLIAELTGA